MHQNTIKSIGLLLFVFVLGVGILPAADQPQWGERHSRNMVSTETGLPDRFEPGMRNYQTGGIDLPDNSGVKWIAKVGGLSYGSPVIAGGKIFVGTNNDPARDERMQEDRGVLMCFDEATGKFLWQLNVPKLIKIKWADWHYIGLTSPPTIEGDRAYVVSNRNEVLCLDVEGMANGNDGPFTDEGRHMMPEGAAPLDPGPKAADILWRYDIIAETKAEPHNGANCSVLVHGDLLYVCTANGVEWTHDHVVHPAAPSLIVLDKRTGKLVARDDFGIGPDITHGQWSSPAMGRVGDKTLGFFGAGNGYAYAFEMLDPTDPGGTPTLLKNVWRFHGHPLAQTQDHVPPDHQHDSTSYIATAMPVFHKNRLYVPFSQEAFHQMEKAWLVCLDATKTGDTTQTGIVWSYKDISSTVSTVAIADGLVYAADFDGDLHCLDAETGKPYWVHKAGGPICGSPMVADGKVYLGTERNYLWVLKAGKQLEVISSMRMRDSVSTTPVAANGVLYVLTNKHLYAVGK
ncbi:MAG: PQQ-binding-like beta-propeller repeat protein [Thermoguttaceae bacterium]